jgi:hypothetical protein
MRFACREHACPAGPLHHWVGCNQHVSCKVHHPHQNNISPAPWSWVEPSSLSLYPPFLLQAGHCGLPAENLHAQLGFCNRVWCNQQVSCKVHHPHLHNLSPAPWSWVEPTASLFILDLWNNKTIRAVDIVSWSSVSCMLRMRLQCCCTLKFVCCLTLSARCAYETKNSHTIKWPLLPPL